MEYVGEYEYSKKDLIGHGAFAIVFSGRKKRKPDEIVAVKCINKKNLSKSQTFPEKEIEILKDLHHENVVALLYFKDTPTSLVLVMEYCNGGDLADYLHSKGTLSEDTIRLFLKQIASAMKVLHSKGIIHRDLKPQNILLSHNLKTKKPRPSPAEIKLKIADFGFARFLEADMMAATLCGSPLYMAPEVIMSQQYDGKADLWSVGTIIFQCLTGSAPFKASNPQELKNFYQRARTTLEPAVPTGTSKELKDLLIRLLKKKQKDRIDFDVFFNHPFLGKTIIQPPTSSSAPMPVPCRTHSFSSDSPEHRTISVSPLSGNMPVSSPEDQALHQRKNSHSPSPHRGMAMMKKHATGSPGSMEKYGTPPSSSSLDNEGLEDDFVLVSQSDLPSDMPLRTMGCQQEKKSTTNTGFSPSGSPHGVKFTLGSSPLRLSPSPTQMQGNNPSDPSTSGRPTSLPIPATARRKSAADATSPTRRKTQERRVSPSSGAILRSPKDRTSPGRVSPQGLIQFGRSASPVGAVGLVSPSSLPALGSPGTGVLHRTSRFPTSPTSPKLNVSLTPPEGANQSPVMTIQAARTSPPSHATGSSGGGSPTHGGYSPSRRRFSTPARCPPLGFVTPSNLPTILGSPTKKIGIMGSPVSPGSHTNSPSQPLNTPFAMARRTQTFSGAICEELQPPRRASSVGETHGFHRSASQGRLSDPFSLKAAFDNLAKSPAVSIDVLPGSVTMATSPPSYPNSMFYIGNSNTPQRRNSIITEGSASSQGSVTFATSPPNMEGPIMFVAPDLPEETLLEPEHTEIVERLQVILGVVEAIIDVAKSRSDPLAESVYTKDTEASPKDTVCFVSEGYRRAEQLVLYARALDLLSAALDMARDEINGGRLQPSNAVRNIVMGLNERYHVCLSKCRGLYDRGILQAPGVEPDTSMITADKLMYSYAIDLCQTAGLDELCGSLTESITRYRTAQMLLHGLCLQAKSDPDREQLLKYKQLLDQRLSAVEKQQNTVPVTS